MSVLLFEDVYKSFAPGFIPRRREVLHGLSFAVEPGEVFGLLGRNGAGKTTAIKLVVGLLFPDRGRVLLQGRPTADPRSRRSLGFLPENPYFYDYLTGAEFLDFYGRLYGLDSATRRRRSAELMARLDLEQAAGLALRLYSKGMIQRLGLAQALVAEPGLLVLDEPMSGLDPIGRRLFRDLILEQRERGATVFFSSHILQDVELLCDRVAIVDRGNLRSVGRLDEFLQNSVSGYDVSLSGVEAIDVTAICPGARVLNRSKDVLLIHVDTEKEVDALVAQAVAKGGRLCVAASGSRMAHSGRLITGNCT